jgi:thymidylate kinase
MKSELVIFEAADGSGKTTQAKLIADAMAAKYLAQPSGTNLVGFLRKEVKENKVYQPFERQLLHCVSHVTDAFKEFRGQSLVMDRCPISGTIYGPIMGLTEAQMSVLNEIHKSVYRECIAEYGYNVTLIYLTVDQRMNDKDQSHYEQVCSWGDIKNNYNKSYIEQYSLGATGNGFFGPTQKTFQHKVTGTKEETFKQLMNIIEGAHATK